MNKWVINLLKSYSKKGCNLSTTVLCRILSPYFLRLEFRVGSKYIYKYICESKWTTYASNHWSNSLLNMRNFIFFCITWDIEILSCNNSYYFDNKCAKQNYNRISELENILNRFTNPTENFVGNFMLVCSGLTMI